MTQGILDFDAARRRRLEGMTVCADHAESVRPGWLGQAHASLRDYVAAHDAPFTIEQFRGWAYERGLPRPTDDRAFGAVTQAAIKAGLIVRVSYAPAASSNGSPKPVYARPVHNLPNAA